MNIFSVMLRYTFFGLLKSMPRELKNWSLMRKLPGDNIKKYWSGLGGDPSNGSILVDLLIDHVGTNHNNLLLAKNIQHVKGGAAIVGLVDYPTRLRIKQFGALFGLSKFVSIWSILNLQSIILSFAKCLSLRDKITYDGSFGISIIVDEQELGDLIYDQYLRETFLPTVHNVDFRYRIFIFKMLFLYYRYKSLISSGSYTDIVLSHKVYGLFGLIGRAAASCDSSIRIWQWYGVKPISITCGMATKSNIMMPRGFGVFELNRMEKYLSSFEIENEFKRHSESRFLALDENQIDLQFVYKNVEINTYDEFAHLFRPRDEKIFIFSHAFVDSVKYTDWHVYSDYYTWLENTLILLAEESKIASIYVKSHPSEELYPCVETVSTLVERINLEYGSEFVYLDRKINNLIVFEHADLVLTSNGSIAMEAPCFGIRVITCAKTLFDGANACIQARTHDEYKHLLARWRSLPYPNAEKLHNAKACFLWFSKYVYTTASFLTFTDYRGDADYAEQLLMVDNGYLDANPVNKQPLFLEVSSLIKGLKHHSDCLQQDGLCAE